MSEKILAFGKDGKAHMYNSEFDVTIHCESEQDMDEAVALLNLANRMHWRKTAENPPTEKDAEPDTESVLALHSGMGIVNVWNWKNVAQFPERFPIWMPLPTFRKEDLT